MNDATKQSVSARLRGLFVRKQELEQQLAVRKSRLIEVERALSHCEQVKKRLPDLIDDARSSLVVPALTVYAAPEDSLLQSREIVRLQSAERALTSLRDDLPAIVHHYERRRKELAS